MRTLAVVCLASVTVSAFQGQDGKPAPPKPVRGVAVNGKAVIKPIPGRPDVGLIGQNGLTGEGQADLPYIEIEALAMAINGTPSLAPTMKLGPTGLVVVATGGCPSCALASKMEGRIGKVVVKDGRRYVAVEDVARALGARLGPVTDHGVSLVGAGDFKCPDCAMLVVK